jgi:hypothetical protein
MDGENDRVVGSSAWLPYLKDNFFTDAKSIFIKEAIMAHLINDYRAAKAYQDELLKAAQQASDGPSFWFVATRLTATLVSLTLTLAAAAWVIDALAY